MVALFLASVFFVWFHSAQCVAEPLDVFLIAGQSNAAGMGDKAYSPKVASGKVLQYQCGAIVDANDPVGNAYTGSAWPSFGQTYYSATRRPVLLVPAAIGSSAQASSADSGSGNWGPTGALVDNALDKLDSAMATATQIGYEPEFIGVLWSQGESDAGAINIGYSSVWDYKYSLYWMVGTIQNHYPNSFFYIFRTGGDDTTGYQQIRQAQEDYASYYHDAIGYPTIGNIRIVFRGAKYFAQNGLLQSGSLHYTQQGYNLMGVYGARAVLQNLADPLMLIEPVYPNDATRILVNIAQ